MFHRIKHIVGHGIINTLGWHTNRKIVVIESDDWGSIRMPNKKVYETLKPKRLIQKNDDSFDDFDSLESEDDLNSLFLVLLKFQDKNGNYPIFTANTVMANPDFEKIKHSDFKEYHYEIFTETYKRYPKCKKSFELWKQGISKKIFCPQFHGREHINVQMWLKSLQNNYEGMRLAFDNQTWNSRVSEDKRIFIVRTFDYINEKEFCFISDSIKDGCKIFKKLFGYTPKSFMAPCYCWSRAVEETLKSCGVDYIQSGLYQFYPSLVVENIKKRGRYHYIGQKNDMNQLYTIRNVIFEPSLSPNQDNVSNCLKGITTAFRLRKPAIISSHRVNYIGGINEINRVGNLKLLDDLLSKLLKKFPDVEFMSSDKLGDLICKI